MSGGAWVSERAAARILAGCGVARRQAREALGDGLAGAPMSTSAATLYRRDRVEELAARPALTYEEARAACPLGMFVGRRRVSVLCAWEDQVSAVSPGWDLGVWTAAFLNRDLREAARPAVFTVAGFIALGADLVHVRARGNRHDLVLEKPGPWFGSVCARRLDAGRGKAWRRELWR